MVVRLQNKTERRQASLVKTQRRLLRVVMMIVHGKGAEFQHAMYECW